MAVDESYDLAGPPLAAVGGVAWPTATGPARHDKGRQKADQ